MCFCLLLLWIKCLWLITLSRFYHPGWHWYRLKLSDSPLGAGPLTEVSVLVKFKVKTCHTYAHAHAHMHTHSNETTFSALLLSNPFNVVYLLPTYEPRQLLSECRDIKCVSVCVFSSASNFEIIFSRMKVKLFCPCIVCLKSLEDCRRFSPP